MTSEQHDRDDATVRLRALVTEVRTEGWASLHTDSDALDALESVLHQLDMYAEVVRQVQLRRDADQDTVRLCEDRNPAAAGAWRERVRTWDDALHVLAAYGPAIPNTTNDEGN